MGVAGRPVNPEEVTILELQTTKQQMKHGFGTRAIHAGQKPDPATGAIMTPIFQSSTFVQSGPAQHKGYEYARVSNPTRTALEGNLASLEGAKHGICFSSGVAATDGVLKCLNPGDHVVASSDLYGGTRRLMVQVFERFGLKFDFVDLTDASAIDPYLTSDLKLVWLETPSNPLMNIIDIAAVSERAATVGAPVAVDNTFASPYLQQPLALGATLVMHSTTKYIGGHSDVVGGAICTNDDEWNESLRFIMKSAGANPGPMDCFLLLRGTKTLHVRMERHCSNARAVATFLDLHPKVSRVYYPGLTDDPGHAVASRQMKDFGGMLSFTLNGDRMEDAVTVLSGTKLFTLAESLGGVESLINHPASMTHASVPIEQRRKIGLSETLIRLSVGIEDEIDLIQDLDNAISKIPS
jgi:cystathionine beta-lyase/cystathionine gamma-synthase